MVIILQVPRKLESNYELFADEFYVFFSYNLQKVAFFSIDKNKNKYAPRPL